MIATHTVASGPTPQDKVSKILIWVLLAVTIGCWGTRGWTTHVTYREAAPLPQQFLAASGQTVMTRDDIVAGKSGFQRADLMDYGSLYGMGAYFGEDYTAEYLVQLAREVQGNLAEERFGKLFASLMPYQQSAITRVMRAALQGIGLSQSAARLPQEVADALVTLRGRITTSLLTDNFAKGYTRAYSLDTARATQTADFLLYSSLTTVARRPGKSFTGRGYPDRFRHWQHPIT